MTSTSRKPEPLPKHDTYQTISINFQPIVPFYLGGVQIPFMGLGQNLRHGDWGSRIHSMSLGSCNLTRSRMSDMQTHHWKPFTLTAWHIQMGKIAALPKFGCHSANLILQTNMQAYCIVFCNTNAYYSRGLKSEQFSWMLISRLRKSRHDRVTAGSQQSISSI